MCKEIKATGGKNWKAKRRSKREIFHVHACNWWAPLLEFHVCKCKTSTKLCMHTFIRHFTWNRKIKHFWAARLKFHFFLSLFYIITLPTQPSIKYGCNFTWNYKTFFYVLVSFAKNASDERIILTKFRKWKFCFSRKILHSIFSIF